MTRRHFRTGHPVGRILTGPEPRDPITLNVPNIDNPNCVGPGIDPDWWFNDNKDRVAVAEREHARSLCNTCPAAEACLAYALRERIRHGIWGGLDNDQRIALTWRKRA